MKTELIKPKRVKEKEDKQRELFSLIIELIIGIILLTNSSKAVVIASYIIGVLVLIFGIYNLYSYYRLKEQFYLEDNQKLTTGIIAILIGIIVIILSAAIEKALRFIIGFILILNGINKIVYSFDNKMSIVTGFILIIIGIYTVLVENFVLQIIGGLLILSSIMDLVTYIKEIKK